MNQFNLLKKLVEEGIELTYGKLTLCDLAHYSHFRGTRRWQIYCSDSKIKFYYIYHDLEVALLKFLELQKKISNRVR